MARLCKYRSVQRLQLSRRAIPSPRLSGSRSLLPAGYFAPAADWLCTLDVLPNSRAHRVAPAIALQDAPGAIAQRLCLGPVPAAQHPAQLPSPVLVLLGHGARACRGGPELREPEAPTVTRTTGCCLRSCLLLLHPCKPPPAAARAPPRAVPAAPTEASGCPDPPRAREGAGAPQGMWTTSPAGHGAPHVLSPVSSWGEGKARVGSRPQQAQAVQGLAVSASRAARRAELVQHQHVQRLLQQGFACQPGIKPVR